MYGKLDTFDKAHYVRITLCFPLALQHPVAGKAKYPSFPFQTDHIPTNLTAAPTLGQNNDEYNIAVTKSE